MIKLPPSISMFYNKMIHQGFEQDKPWMDSKQFNQRASTMRFSRKELTRIKMDMDKLGFVKYNSRDKNAVIEKKLKGLFE